MQEGGGGLTPEFQDGTLVNLENLRDWPTNNQSNFDFVLNSNITSSNAPFGFYVTAAPFNDYGRNVGYNQGLLISSNNQLYADADNQNEANAYELGTLNTTAIQVADHLTTFYNRQMVLEGGAYVLR